MTETYRTGTTNRTGTQDTGANRADLGRIDVYDDEQTDAWLVDASRRLEEPDRDIARLISSITGKIGRVRRNGRPLDTDDERVQVNDRVVKQLLATRIRHALGRLVVLVELDAPGNVENPDVAEDTDLSDTAVTRVRIGLIARYHDDLVADSDRVREVADTVLASALGPTITATARRHIDIRWQDLYTRNWID